jgi:hypothetical protein
MGAPNLTYSYTGTKVSSVPGYDSISITFASDIAYQAFECRATRAGESYGVGVGALIASFSQTPAVTSRTFEIYDDYLTQGDGDYRISLWAQSSDGAWNDGAWFRPAGSANLVGSDGKIFFCAR